MATIFLGAGSNRVENECTFHRWMNLTMFLRDFSELMKISYWFES
jgi:hypothetical protein